MWQKILCQLAYDTFDLINMILSICRLKSIVFSTSDIVVYVYLVYHCYVRKVSVKEIMGMFLSLR